MDILFFLKERTRLIYKYYEGGCQPFNEIIIKIEGEEEPFIPSHSEDPEPPFLSEWMESQDMLEIMGRSCLTMLSASLQLYFMTWERELELSCGSVFKNTFKRDGFINGYKNCLAKYAGINWDECPADLIVIEQVILARNRDQHPDDITTIRVTHADNDLKKHPHPFFISQDEIGLLDSNSEAKFLMSPILYVSKESLLESIIQIEILCSWLEEKLIKIKYTRGKYT